jgi:Amt family ammonium transporter
MVLGLGVAFAQEGGPPPQIDSGDTTWVLVCSALVLLMTIPGLALFYSGMVRRKNALGTIMQSFIIAALISIQWVLWGYSLAFGPDVGGIIGNLDWFGLTGVGLTPNPDYAGTIPHQAFMVFQMMFAIITPALITGAFAERMKFSSFLIFTLLWATFIYDPLAHWVWGGGWLGELGALDFAGGTVVHISSGISALACAIIIGRRVGYGADPMPPHSDTAQTQCPPITCHSPSWEHLSSGWAGSDSTQDLRSQPTSWPPMPSSSPTQRRRQPPCPGWCANG